MSGSSAIYTKCQRIAEMARNAPDMAHGHLRELLTQRVRDGVLLRLIGKWLVNRHEPLREQHAGLSRKLQGHFGYFGITGNSEALARLRNEATRIWFKWVRRRGQRRPMDWDRFNRLLQRFPLPPAIAVHSRLRRAAKA